MSNWMTCYMRDLSHYKIRPKNSLKIKKNVILTKNSFYIFSPDINKGSPIDYKSGSACSTPTKDTLKSYDRNCMGPVLPPRGAMCPPTNHYSPPLNFRKGLTSKCSWKCTTLAVSVIGIAIFAILIYILGKNFLDLSFYRLEN